jgi:hypothetical protein
MQQEPQLDTLAPRVERFGPDAILREGEHTMMAK